MREEYRYLRNQIKEFDEVEDVNLKVDPVENELGAAEAHYVNFVIKMKSNFIENIKKEWNKGHSRSKSETFNKFVKKLNENKLKIASHRINDKGKNYFNLNYGEIFVYYVNREI